MTVARLFSRISIFDLLRHRQEVLRNEIGELPESVLREGSEEILVQRLSARYKLDVPVLDEEKTYISHREVDVDVRNDPMRIILDRSTPCYKKGTEITFAIPFKGKPDMFEVQPATHIMGAPVGKIVGHEIHLVRTTLNSDAQAIRNEYQGTLQEIKQHLGWLQESIGQFNAGVGEQVRQKVVQRLAELGSAADMIAAIGFPVQLQPPPNVVEEPRTVKARQRSSSSPKKWDVFISHSSEDKEAFVRPLALWLRREGASVWYDEFSLNIGDSLRASIDYGLANSRFGIVVLSKSFFAKHWPAQELNALMGREINGRKLILPIWHEVTRDEVQAFSPMLSDLVAGSSSDGVEKLAADIMAVVQEV